MPTVALTNAQKVKVRHHMGYVNVGQVATFALGTPAALETQFMIETAMNKVLPEALPELERLVGILDAVEEQKVADLELAAVNEVGEISVNQGEQRQLDKQYAHWQAALANLLGVPPNPFDGRQGARGLNARVL